MSSHAPSSVGSCGAEGHDVRIAVPPNMVALAESVGLDVMAYGPDSHAQLNTAADFFVGNMKNPYAALPEVVERVTKVWVDKGTALASLAEDADLLVTGMNEQRLAANIAEHQDIPLVALHFFPSRLQPSGRAQLLTCQGLRGTPASGAGPAGGARARAGVDGDSGLRRTVLAGAA